MRAPRSWARPMSETRISAVACASGSARWHGRTEVPKNCASEASPTRGMRPASSRRASPTVSTTGAARRRPEISSTSRSRKARSKRALWATRTACSPAKARKRLTAAGARGAPRRSRSWIPVRPAITGGSSTPGSTSVWNVPAGSSASMRTAPISQIPARAGRRPVVSRSTTTKRAASRGSPWPGGAVRPTQSPRQARRASPSTTSSSKLRASATGAWASAKSERAASSAGTGPLRSSTSSTSRSAASNASCTHRRIHEHMFVL